VRHLRTSGKSFVDIDNSFVSAALTEMNYDARKMPLGKLAKSTLLQGFAALKVTT
jgi:hypothetical protein